MDIDTDPAARAGLTRREVRSGERNGEPTRIVVAERAYRTARTDLWDALTNPERLPRWFLPISGDLVPGGSYQLEGNAGGTVEECHAPERFAVTWEFGGGLSWLAVQLRDAGPETVLELCHEAPIDDHWKRFGPGAVGIGWDLSLVGLGLHVGTGRQLDPAEFEAWTVSPAGKEFVRSASAGWGEADIAGGEDPELAGTRAEQSRAFFTGESTFSWDPDAD